MEDNIYNKINLMLNYKIFEKYTDFEYFLHISFVELQATSKL